MTDGGVHTTLALLGYCPITVAVIFTTYYSECSSLCKSGGIVWLLWVVTAKLLVVPHNGILKRTL